MRSVMHHGGPARRCLLTLMAGLLLALIAVSDAPAGEWEDIRESYGNTLRTYEKRIGEIEAKERGVPDQEQRADKITSEWGAQGAERKKLREAMATVQKNFERVNANLARAAKATTASVKPSDVLEKAARIDAAVSEAGERLRTRWQLEQAARERESKQREREAAERARGAR